MLLKFRQFFIRIGAKKDGFDKKCTSTWSETSVLKHGVQMLYSYSKPPEVPTILALTDVCSVTDVELEEIRTCIRQVNPLLLLRDGSTEG